MANIERIVLKIAVIQFLFLLIAQIFIHRFDFHPELKTISKYEGTESKTYTEILETFQGK
ncbi:hypothetical protein D1B31_09885 [Neobacillus notoginsengisoli]|uniref:YpfB family protein n=1 Tax=Neobacillus notoginsengisoli TaxID=1578198 RepID=A0A417YVA1_9BACI|nr:YpfB family protein [Neobacillus notoginsengisoli]RHW41231.1 hypothetical protein D1B31_09885 [Neobacillus notoginsengisoli]